MTLKAKQVGYFQRKDEDDGEPEQLNELFNKERITSENIFDIIPRSNSVIVIWDDGERPI